MITSMESLPFIGQIATQGVVGMILALSLFVNWYLIKTIQQVNEKRVQDAQDMTNKLLDPVNAIKTNSELLITLFSRFLSNIGSGDNNGNGRNSNNT